MTQINTIISFFGDLLDPHLFSQLIGFSPTDFWFKGDIVPNRKIFRQETCWEYSQGFIETLDLVEAYSDILDKFKNNISRIENYLKSNNIYVKIDIVVEVYDNQSPSLYFNKDILNFINRLDGNIDIDLYIM
jgi:hypothetical protein